MSNFIAVTGASGFVGRYFIEEMGTKVRPISRTKLCHQNSVVVESIDSNTDWEYALADCTSVIHLAALAHTEPSGEFLLEEVNVRGTIRLFEESISRGVERFIYVSTIGIHGTASFDTPFTPFDSEKPNGAYAESKLLAETELKKIASSSDIELVIIRPPLIYGKDAPGNFLSLINFMSTFPILPFGLARNSRDFISIYNFVDFLKYCLGADDVLGKIILPTDNDTMSIREFTTKLALCLGKKVYQFPVPVFLIKWVAKAIGKERVFQQLFGNLEVDYEANNISWSPKYTVSDSLKLFKG